MRARNTKALFGKWNGTEMHLIPFDEFREHITLAFGYRNDSTEQFDQWLDAEDEWYRRTGKIPHWLKHPPAKAKPSHMESRHRIKEEAIRNGISLRINPIGKTATHWMFNFGPYRLVDYWPTTGSCRYSIDSIKFSTSSVPSPDAAMAKAVEIKGIRCGDVPTEAQSQSSIVLCDESGNVTPPWE